MIAKKAVESKGTCPRCEKDSYLNHDTTIKDKKVKICDPCFLDKQQTSIPLDEYDLQLGELTKEMAATELKKTVKTIENYIKAGKIAAEKAQRRTDGGIKEIVLIQQSELDKYIEKATGTKQIPQPMPPEETSLAVNNQTEFMMQTQAIMLEGMNKLAENLNRTALPAAEDSREKFITVKNASTEYDLSESIIKQLIKDSTLTKLTGRDGTIKVSRKQIENI